MRQINLSSSALTILNRFSAYLLARLHGNPQLGDVTADAQKAHDDLYQGLQSYWSIQQATMRAASVRDSRKYQCEVALRSFRTAVLGWVHNDRASKLYNTLFPDGFSAVIRYDAQVELQLARNVLVKMAENVVPELAPAAQALQAAVDDLGTALADFATAERAESEAWAALQRAKATYSSRYDAVYCQLLTRLSERGLVESYFRRAVPSSPAAPPQPAPASEPKPEPETAPAAASLAVVPKPAADPHPEAADSKPEMATSA